MDYQVISMRAYIASLYRFFSSILFRQFHGISSPCIEPDPKMASYTCTVSVQAGEAPEDAKAHHVKDKFGRLVSFENPNPSYGIFRDLSLIQGLSMFLR